MVRGNNVSVDGHISSSSPVVHLVLMCSMESVQCWHKCVKCFSTKYEKSIVSLDEKIIEDHNTFQLRITQKWDSDQLHWHQNLVFHVPSRDPMLRKFKMWPSVCQYDRKWLNVDSTPWPCICCLRGFLLVLAELGGLGCAVLLLQVHQSHSLARKRNCRAFKRRRTSRCGCMGATHREEQQNCVMEEAA